MPRAQDELEALIASTPELAQSVGETIAALRRMRSAASILASVAATASASSRRASHAVEELVPVVFTSLSFST